MNITDRAYAIQLDEEDTLKQYRQQFHIPQHNGKDAIYLNGNSLGLQPKSTKDVLDTHMESWKNFAVEGWFKDQRWVDLHKSLCKLMAPIVGAQEHEVVLMNSLTVNLHLLMVSFYRPTDKRNKILIEGKAFPSDQYAVKSQIEFHGYDPKKALIEVKPDQTGVIDQRQIVNIIEKRGDEIALLLLGGVNYYTGQIMDMELITKHAHKKGITVGFDLAHAVGNIPLDLHEWKVDFAVWCTYKYLNSGPGAIAGAYIHESYLTDELRDRLPRLEGWWGVNLEKRFLMEDTFESYNSVQSWQVSTPAILSLVPIIPSLEIFKEVGMRNLRSKSMKLTGYLEQLLHTLETDKISITPPATIRGSQISVHIKKNGKKLYDELLNQGVICDWREPDVIRIAPVPLYNTFTDVYDFYEVLRNNLGLIE
ncbi:MAG: kynureninase [Candidatus Heimdallarchaeota archaeon]|nr:kynureninase [Candidatus Heimdallarchaeota archaeon]